MTENQTQVNVALFCDICGIQMDPQLTTCPQCKVYTTKTYKVQISESIAMLETMKAKSKTERGLPLSELMVKSKISVETKMPTSETLRFDHTHPDKTVKIHHVVEHRPAGSVVVHDEHIEYPSKRR